MSVCKDINGFSNLFQYTAIDEYSRIRFLYSYEGQNTYSLADLAIEFIYYRFNISFSTVIAPTTGSMTKRERLRSFSTQPFKFN